MLSRSLPTSWASRSPLDVAVDLRQAAAPEVEILAEVAGLQRVDRTVMLADRALCRRHELVGQFGTDEVAAIIAQLCETPGIGAGDGLRGRVFGDERAGEHAVERLRT